MEAGGLRTVSPRLILELRSDGEKKRKQSKEELSHSEKSMGQRKLVEMTEVIMASSQTL